MFDLWGIRKQRRKDKSRYAVLDGEVRALLLVIGSMISLMPEQERNVLIEVIKTQVGKGFTSDDPWLDTKESKQIYNDSLSVTLQNFIKVRG